MNVSIYIGEDKIDLFKDETIEITSSVTNVNDISKNTLDFSKNFTVPASEINNKIFKHWYNSDIENGFDARLKVEGRIEINGVVFKYGKLSLLSVKLKQNKPSSYSLVFYGNAISLVDLLGSDELSSLDLSAYDHAYNDTNVYEGLKNSLFSGDIIYPLMAKKRYYYSSSVTNDGVQSLTNHSNISNVAWANGINWIDLRAAIKLIRIIEAIEFKYGFTFSRDFFGRVEFDSLYLWLTNESENKIVGEEVIVDFDTTDDPNFNLSTNKGIYPDNKTYSNRFSVTPEPGYESVTYTIRKYNNQSVQHIRTGNGFKIINDTDPRGGGTNTVYYTIETTERFIYTALFRVSILHPLGYVIDTHNTTSPVIDYNPIYITSNNIPKIKVIDFLKCLFQMFKLVILQDKSTDPIYINTLKEYYSTANLFDITQHVSIKEIDIEKGKLLNEISFKYEDPQTILAKQFKDNTGLSYGDNELILKDDLDKKLEGEKEDIKLPFEQVVYERLTDVNNNNQTNIQVGSVVDDKFEGVNLKPHIFYNVKNNNTSFTLKFRNNNGTTFGFGAAINTPSHTSDFSNTPGHSLVFDREFSTYTAATIENTLYTNYHKEYIESIFQVKRRNTKVESKLPLRIILNLKLKDVIKIKDNYYRINTWTYNLLNGIAKLDLINSFDNTINGFNSDRTIIDTDGGDKIESIYVTNFNNLIFDYSATWISSATFLGNNVYFGIDANDTGLIRTEIVTIINSDTLAEVEITINQTPNIITFGSEVILWGSTEITFNL